MRGAILATLVIVQAHGAEQNENASQADAQSEGPAVVTSPAAAPDQANPQSSTPAGPSRTPPATRQISGTDRLELDTTVVTGNRELPKVLYIVPWKKADLGDLPGQPFNSLLDEVLTPVDRDVFRREVTYYDAVSGSASSATPIEQGSVGRSEK